MCVISSALFSNFLCVSYASYCILIIIRNTTEIFHILRYLADLDLMRTHAIPNVWECSNSQKMEIFCGKPYYTQGVGFSGNPNNPQGMVNPKSETLGILCEKFLKIYSHAMGFDQKSLKWKTHTILRYGKLVPWISQCMGIFFPSLWKKDGNTHIFSTLGFWKIFPVLN